MKIVKRILLLLLIIGFTGIQLASFIDDPQHHSEPDPDCFFCMVSQTSVCINHIIAIDFTPDVIIYLTENIFLEPCSHQYHTNFSTRAPPFLSV